MEVEFSHYNWDPLKQASMQGEGKASDRDCGLIDCETSLLVTSFAKILPIKVQVQLTYKNNHFK